MANEKKQEEIFVPPSVSTAVASADPQAPMSLSQPMPGNGAGMDMMDLIALATLANGPKGLLGNPNFQVFKNHPGANNLINQTLRNLQYATMTPQEKMVDARMRQENQSALSKALMLMQSRKLQMMQTNAALQERVRHDQEMEQNWATVAGIRQQNADTTRMYRVAQMKNMMMADPDLKKQLMEAQLEWQKLRNDPNSFVNRNNMIRTLSWLPRNFAQMTSTFQRVYGQTVSPEEMQNMVNTIVRTMGPMEAPGTSAPTTAQPGTPAAQAGAPLAGGKQGGSLQFNMNYVPTGQGRDWAGNPVGNTNYAQTGPTSQQRNRGQFARDMITFMNTFVMPHIDTLTQKGELGPVLGRMRNELLEWGLQKDPDFARFVTDSKLGKGATASIHFGGRGIAEQFQGDIGFLLSPSQPPTVLKANLEELLRLFNVYARSGGISVTQPPLPGETGPGPHYLNPGTEQKGSQGVKGTGGAVTITLPSGKKVKIE